MHIGVYNCHPEREPVTFDIRMREMSCSSCLPEEIAIKNDVFNIVHEGTDAHLASDMERSEKNLQWQTELIYGEVLF